MITVTNNNDSGAGSLRQAIADAALGEEITFSITGTITLTTGELLISQDVIITGPGSSSLTIDGNGASRCFNTDSGVISISGLLIFNGADSQGGGLHNEATLTMVDVSFNTCVSSDEGGAIWNSSTVDLTDSSIASCTASAGGGGAIKNTGTCTLNNTSITTCEGVTVDGNGGAVWSDGSFTMNGGGIGSCVSAGFDGGGAIYTEGTCDLTEVTLTGNNTTAGSGDGILNVFGTLTIIRCAVWANDATGLVNRFGTTNIDNSTFSGHTASNINNDLGALDIKRSTITLGLYGVGNADPGSVFTFSNTILAGNTFDYSSFAADITSEGNNIYGTFDVDPVTPAAGDITITDFASLVIGPLQENGGPTRTHALLAGSPALDAGNGTGAPSTDQRGVGFPREINGTMDIGAFEADIEPEPPEPPEPPTPTPEPSPFPQPEPPAPPSVPDGTRTCPIPASPCTRPEEPIINSSSESPDTVDYFSGMVYGFGDWDPPLNRGFYSAVGCGVTCLAPTQEEANECAERIANSCEEEKNPEPDPTERFGGGGGGTPFPPIDPEVPTIVRPLFGNEEYTAYTICSDGTQSSYTVAAGRFTALTQAQANSMAHAFGDKTVIERRWCITPITALHCLAQPISGFFSATGYNPQIPLQIYPIEEVSGTIPQGVSFIQFEPGIWTAQGTPTEAGFYTFTVRITNGDGTTKTSTMNMLIWGITKDLPNPEIGVAYSEQMTSSGSMQEVTYSVTSGELPPGLTMTEAGLLSGTPTEEGTFFFIVQASAVDSLGTGSCSKEYTLEIASQCLEFKSNFVPVPAATNAYSVAAGSGVRVAYFAVSEPGGLTVCAVDVDNDVTIDNGPFANYIGFEIPCAYSASQNRLYVAANGPLDVNFLQSFHGTTLIDFGATSFNGTIPGPTPVRMTYIPLLDEIVLTAAGVGMTTFSCPANLFLFSTTTGNEGGVEVAYSPVTLRYYTPTELPTPRINVRNTSLTILDTIDMGDYYSLGGIVYNQAEEKLVMLAVDDGDDMNVVVVIDPATNTITNEVETSIHFSSGSPISITQDQGLGLVYMLCGAPSQSTLIVFNVATEEIVCEIANASNPVIGQMAVNTDTNQLYIAPGNNGNEITKYGPPA